MGGAYALLIFIASFAKEGDGTLATWYYFLLVLIQNFGSVGIILYNDLDWIPL